MSTGARNTQAIRFLGQVLQNPAQVGSVTPSSRHLTRAMVAGVPVSSAGLVVEYGPGTGALTRVLADALPGTGRLVAMETNPAFCLFLARHFPLVRVIGDEAANAHLHLGAELGTADAVFSGLPSSLMTPADLAATVRATDLLLRPGGHFRAFLYHHTYWLPKMTFLRRLLQRRFRQVDVVAVWANFPPAMVLRCIK